MQKVGLVIIDEIHLLGGDRGPVLEVIVSRMRYIAAQTGAQTPIRVVGLSTALANAHDLADWLGIGHEGLYNFPPSVRPVPLTVHISGFPGILRGGLQPFYSVSAILFLRAHSLQFTLVLSTRCFCACCLSLSVALLFLMLIFCIAFFLSPPVRPPRPPPPGKHYCPRMATMNKPTYAAITTYSPAKPVLVFVSSRRQTRLTALDLISFLAADDNPRKWLKLDADAMEAVLSGVQDQACGRMEGGNHSIADE